jgi:hypothetical protein
MKKPEILLELEAMGAFFHSRCIIALNRDKNKIYCDCINDAPECDMAQLGWGGTAYCPLYNFVYDINDKEKWKEHLKWAGLEYCIEIIEEKLAGAQPAE